MQASLSVLLTIQVALVKGFLNTKVIQESENITLDYEVIDGLFSFQLSARAREDEETQLGLVFSDRVSTKPCTKHPKAPGLTRFVCFLGSTKRRFYYQT